MEGGWSAQSTEWFGRRSPLRIGFDEPTAGEACGEFRPKVRGHRPLPCRDTGRAIAVSPHQNPFQFFALISSFSVGFDGFDKSGALIFNNAPSRALRFPGARESQRCCKTVTYSRTQRVRPEV